MAETVSSRTNAEMATILSGSEKFSFFFLGRRDLMLVPLQAWELVHLSTYHRKLLSLYAKLRQEQQRGTGSSSCARLSLSRSLIHLSILPPCAKASRKSIAAISFILHTSLCYFLAHSCLLPS